jgi:hypothetical protein
VSMTLFRLIPTTSWPGEMRYRAIDSEDVDPAEKGATCAESIAALEAAGWDVEDSPELSGRICLPWLLDGSEEIRPLRMSNPSRGEGLRWCLLVRWRDRRDMRELMCSYLRDEVAWHERKAHPMGMDVTRAGPIPAVLRLQELMRHVIGLAPDDPRVAAIAAITHAKEVERYVPGEWVGREILTFSSGSGETADAFLTRLVGVTRQAARQERRGPCAFCTDLAECGA